MTTTTTFPEPGVSGAPFPEPGVSEGRGPRQVEGRPDAPAVLTARNLVKRFGDTTVLHGVDVDIHEGEFVSIMGPSGCGKSTLLYALSGMDVPTEGTVELDGTVLTGLPQKELARLRLTRMGFVFQQVHLLRNLTLLDNVVLPAHLAGLAPRDELAARAMELMARTGVAHLANHDISQASGGQLQRVGICRALVNRPRVLFADEPTGALDSTSAAEVLDILTELNEDGMTIVMVTHDVGVASRTHRVIEMGDGRIL
ncbi:ABC transporter ATP-binding protein [Tessaracoccus lubricantis]|uniref:ABC transporter ATP-binding protein n=1 Tax=Tessaracoccus lubricantis TaxID=545543 RepID=A0ABP9F9E5_9ACTN